MTVYVAEEFTPDEADILRRYFTNLDGPVFALVNLPEVVKGALFARYSRSPKSLRRLFLDEFVGDLDITGDASRSTPPSACSRAEELYDRVFFEYGDDSVAQLGGVHLACEQASNLLTKVLEWGRLMSYLEQSHPLHRLRRPPRRPLPLLPRPGGARQSALGTRYVGDMDRLFDTYAELAADACRTTSASRFPKDAGDSRLRLPPGHPGQGASTPSGASCRRRRCPTSASTAPARPTRRSCCACGPIRCPRPAPTPTSCSPSCARSSRQLPASGSTSPTGAWPGATTWPTTRTAHGGGRRHGCSPTAPSAERRRPAVDAGRLRPRRRGQARRRACSTPTPTCPRPQIEARVRAMTADERLAVVRAYVRRAGQPPPQARAGPSSAPTTASTCWPTTAPSATSSATACSPSSGSRSPRATATPGPRPSTTPARPTASTRPWSARPPCYDALAERFPDQAPYAVSLAYRVRFVMQLNAREAMHLLELRTDAAGPSRLPAGRPRRCTGSSPRRPATAPSPR